MEKEIYVGKFIANAKGFGFVEVEDLETDIFIGDMDAVISSALEMCEKELANV